MIRLAITATIAAAVALLAAASSAAQGPYETVTLTLPKGDGKAGRQAFQDLKCTACHRVAGETGFPAPTSDSRGPDLDRTLRLRPAGDVAAAIIVPSHSMSVKTSDELKQRLQIQSASPMGDFSRAISVRQLADLLAYLGTIDSSR